MLFEERKLFTKRKYICTSSLWEIDCSYLSEILFNAVFSVGFKSLLRLNVDSHPPHVHGKLSNQIFAVRVKRADSRNLGPLIPLRKLCQSLSLIDVWGACAEEVWISLFIWELSGSRGIWNLRNVLVFCGLSDGNWATRSGLSDNKVSVVWEILKAKNSLYIRVCALFLHKKFKDFSRTPFSAHFRTRSSLYESNVLVVETRVLSLCLFKFFQNMSNFIPNVFLCLLLFFWSSS